MVAGGQEDLPVKEGEVVAGKYRIMRVLGTGGMGVVVAAHHLHLDESVAIKFLHSSSLSSREVVARFIREARAAVKIKSEHVGRVFDVGILESGAPYIVMEYLEGRDLSEYVQEHAPLPIEQAVEFILQACEALAEAHALGIVHRDLKPANLFCTKRADGLLAIKVLDFGISKTQGSLSSASNGAMTKTNTIMGSPYYMSPEQMQSTKDVDARTDIWGLGVILYELLTGTVPFAGDTLPEICARVITQQHTPLRERRVDVSPELDAAIARCLVKNPQDRYANVAEVALALAPFAPLRARGSVDRILRVVRAAGLPESSAVPAAAQAPDIKTSRADTIAPLGQTLPNRPRTRIVAFSLLAGVLAVCVLIGLVAVLRHKTAESIRSIPVQAASSARSANAVSDLQPPARVRPAEPKPTELVPVLSVVSPDAGVVEPLSSSVVGNDLKPHALPKPKAGQKASEKGKTSGSVPANKSPKSAPQRTESDDPLGGQY